MLWEKRLKNLPLLQADLRNILVELELLAAQMTKGLRKLCRAVFYFLSAANRDTNKMVKSRRV